MGEGGGGTWQMIVKVRLLWHDNVGSEKTVSSQAILSHATETHFSS